MYQARQGIVAAFLCVAFPVAAKIEPASMPLGPVALTPSINIQTGYDDNIFSVTTDETDSQKTIITPNFELIAEDGFNAYRLIYSFRKGFYHSSSDDNYTDHKLTADAHIEFDARNTLDLNASLSKNHEQRGTGITESGGIGAGLDAPLEYDNKAASFIYTYGANNAAGRLVFAGRSVDKEYTNFRSITDQRDNEEITLGATFFYRIQPKTSLLFEARHQDLNYKTDPAVSLDSNTQRYYVGATWEGTAKTTGTIKLGRVEKDFEAASRDDFSGNSWEASVKWEPRTYSTINLSTSQSEKESSGTGDFIDSKAIRISWNHDWNDQLQSVLSTGYSNDDYKGDPAAREDKITDATIRLNYDMRRWLSFGISYSYQDTDSNATGIPFTRNVYLLSVTGSL